MSEVVDTIRKVAQHEVNKIHVAELGKVTSIFPHEDGNSKDNYECTVQLKNRDLELRKVPVSTQGIGLANIPRVGDLVLVVFVNGDINAPVIVGRLYNDQDRPPENKAGELIFKPPYSKDTDLKRFHLEFPGGVTFTIKDDSIVAVTGKTKVTIKVDGDITIESNAKIDVKATGDLNLSGDNVKIESQKQLQISAGTTAEVTGKTGMTLESKATMDVKANAMMNVNSNAVLAIKGTLVQIN